MEDSPRIESLRRQHESLDRMIREEEKRPAPDEGLLRVWKREKLKIKDEIEGHTVVSV